MTTLRQAAQQALVAMGINQYTVAELAPHKVVMKFNDAITALRTALEQPAEPVAWDVFELRLYGAPQEKQHRVLWVDRYIHPDGSTPDLDNLLEAAKTEGGIDGRAKTLHVRPLYATLPAAQREWQGLTDEDWEKVANRKNTVLDTFEQGATWAAYKLERRNT